jgi:cell division protein FtsL
MSSSGSPVEPVLVTPLRSAAARKQARLRAQLSWRRAAVRLLVGGVVAAAVVRIGAIALQPLVATYRSGRAIQSLEGQYHSELARRNHLQREIQYLSTNAGIEEEARRLGWVKEGETALQILRPAGVSRDTLALVASPRKLSGAERVKQWLGTWLIALRHKPVNGAKL